MARPTTPCIPIPEGTCQLYLSSLQLMVPANYSMAPPSPGGHLSIIYASPLKDTGKAPFSSPPLHGLFCFIFMRPTTEIWAPTNVR